MVWIPGRGWCLGSDGGLLRPTGMLALVWLGKAHPFYSHISLKKVGLRETKSLVQDHIVMSDSSQPNGLQPTRLLHPWDFPGKSTEVGCHCLLREKPITTSYL